jgi:ferric-dicitrate binding protein FerR (iron transport regulator)
MTPCDALDDFLAHDLTAADRQRFTAHLPACAACRRAVRDHERLTGLLTTATTQLEPIPAGLTVRVERRLRRARRRRFATAAAALAATAAVVWLLRPAAPNDEPVQPPRAHVRAVPPAPEETRPAERVRVTFPAGANVLAVPVPTDAPNVTFVWVYPAAPVANDRPSPPTRNDS